jgi:hypothetical protein
MPLWSVEPKRSQNCRIQTRLLDFCGARKFLQICLTVCLFSGLPESVLNAIWSSVGVSSGGQLSRQEFYSCLVLIALAQVSNYVGLTIVHSCLEEHDHRGSFYVAEFTDSSFINRQAKVNNAQAVQEGFRTLQTEWPLTQNGPSTLYRI